MKPVTEEGPAFSFHSQGRESPLPSVRMDHEGDVHRWEPDLTSRGGKRLAADLPPIQPAMQRKAEIAQAG